MLTKALDELKSIHIEIDENFLFEESMDAPLLKGVEILLESIEPKGLKLTPSGYLPTKVVKEIMLNAHTKLEEIFLKEEKRFYEAENLSASMARVVAQNLSLIRVQKGKLYLTKKGEQFLKLTPTQRYIVLFADMFRLNLAYFDYMEEALCVYGASVVMLQLLRDKQRQFRDVEVYVQLLFADYPQIQESLADCIDAESKLEVFTSIVETRLFGRFYLPLGLIDVENVEDFFDRRYAKSELLEKFVKPKNELKKDLILSKNKIIKFQKQIESNKLDIDLLEAIVFLFIQLALLPMPPKEEILSVLLQKHKVLGTLEKFYRDLYSELIDSVVETIAMFTQYEMVGKGDYLQKQYNEFIDGLIYLALKEKPFVTFKKITFIPIALFDFLQAVYKIDMTSPSAFEEIEKIFGDEFSEDLSVLVFTFQKIERMGKKLKKNKPQFVESIRDLFTTFFILIFELRTLYIEESS